MKDLFDMPSPPPARAFNGPEYKPERDHARLSGQIARVFECMRDAKWRTLDEIAGETGDGAASISAQLRHLRKEKWGSHTVNRRHVESGLFQYQLIVKK